MDRLSCAARTCGNSCGTAAGAHGCQIMVVLASYLTMPERVRLDGHPIFGGKRRPPEGVLL
jgi:hypothetical protein